jgi:hypothetical protein
MRFLGEKAQKKNTGKDKRNSFSSFAQPCVRKEDFSLMVRLKQNPQIGQMLGIFDDY